MRSNSRGIKNGDVRDLGLAKEGQALIDWAAREMPVLLLIRDRFKTERPLAGLRVDFEVQEPPELVEHIRALADRYHRAVSS